MVPRALQVMRTGMTEERCIADKTHILYPCQILSTFLFAGGCERNWNWYLFSIGVGQGEAIIEAEGERIARGETCQHFGWSFCFTTPTGMDQPYIKD